MRQQLEMDNVMDTTIIVTATGTEVIAAIQLTIAVKIAKFWEIMFIISPSIVSVHVITLELNTLEAALTVKN
jgi:hypothetical protein